MLYIIFLIPCVLGLTEVQLARNQFEVLSENSINSTIFEQIGLNVWHSLEEIREIREEVEGIYPILQATLERISYIDANTAALRAFSQDLNRTTIHSDRTLFLILENLINSTRTQLISSIRFQEEL